jgi:hypothetical protein
MAIFLWYSAGSQETGIWLAERLKITEHGTVPPRNFEGSVVCWGAVPSEKFKWEKRNFQNIFNDPRKVGLLKDRKLLFDGVAAVGIPSVRCTIIPQANPQFLQICQELDVLAAKGFILCTSSGFRRKQVANQAELTAALGGDKPRTHAMTNDFGNNTRARVFVADGTILGAAQYTDELSDETFMAKTVNDVTEEWGDYTKVQVASIIRRALELKLIKSACGAWSSYAIINPVMRNRALTVANNLGFDFCAIDFSTDGSMTVLNIVTNPNLREVTSVQSTITNAVSNWVATNSRTAKDILLDHIGDASAPEASALLEELRGIKGKIGEAAEKEAVKQAVASAADKVGSGTDSSPTKSA